MSTCLHPAGASKSGDPISLKRPYDAMDQAAGDSAGTHNPRTRPYPRQTALETRSLGRGDDSRFKLAVDDAHTAPALGLGASTTPGSTAAKNEPGTAISSSSGYSLEGACGIVNVGSARWSVDASESGLAAPPERHPALVTGKNGALDAVSSRSLDNTNTNTNTNTTQTGDFPHRLGVHSEDGGSDSASRTADLECPYYQRATGLLAILTEQIERLEAELADAQRECRRRAASVCARGIGRDAAMWLSCGGAGCASLPRDMICGGRDTGVTGQPALPSVVRGRLLPAIQSSHKGSTRRLDAS
ncbi:uncharacterized protein B0H18DRAFT_957891 [Fomitopsis serialis]|uniref:uncharacterized protein n=1 Tax=Fomitopsis serialis TaxID=139415 RepID=UPI0020084BB5|nr:uncharacterized protein B0H18DRAFT_957891 [Neoantrodia serialis]KAH9918486.1 hypothetical protein B0H18DRAFT_957891 [Neoantrodia serialis]